MNRKHILIILSILLLLPWGGYGAKAKKAVFIIVDGVPADMIERLKPPAIGRIAAEGGYSRAYCGGIAGTYCETPTISAVGYNCILTSAWANKHNVWDNSPKPDYSYWSIFRIAKEQKRDVTTALYSSWTDNRTVLLGEGLPETGDLRIDYVVDGFDLDQKNYPKEKDDLQVYRIDDTVSRAAAAGIREQAPDLSWVYLWYTDDAGHIYGNGDYFDEYVMKADRQIERIWEAVEYREKYFDEEWMVVVTTDHGRGDDGHHHGGQSARERTSWIATNVRGNARFAEPWLSIVDIAPSLARFLDFRRASGGVVGTGRSAFHRGSRYLRSRGRARQPDDRADVGKSRRPGAGYRLRFEDQRFQKRTVRPVDESRPRESGRAALRVRYGRRSERFLQVRRRDARQSSELLGSGEKVVCRSRLHGFRCDHKLVASLRQVFLRFGGTARTRFSLFRSRIEPFLVCLAGMILGGSVRGIGQEGGNSDAFSLAGAFPGVRSVFIAMPVSSWLRSGSDAF